MQHPHPDFPTTAQLLVAGDDPRIALDPESGANKYACPPFPDPELAAFGSSTASVISTAGFAAAERLRDRLASATGAQAGAPEFERMREELIRCCGLSDPGGLKVALLSSGTDLHRLAAQLAGSAQERPTQVVMVEAGETGSGVVEALAGSGNMEITQVPIRLEDGSPRPATDVDAEVAARVSAASAQGRHILLILLDVSKTGLLAPSPACVALLHARSPGSLDVLVDACQFRIATSTLRAYLQQGFMVGLTGSKFISGPSFSGALLLPSSAAPHLHAHFSRYSAGQNSDATDLGLLLRWEAALEELRAFRALPEDTVSGFLKSFAQAIHQRLCDDPAFEILPTHPLDRRPLNKTSGWDTIQTIFPFLLYDCRAGRRPLSRAETAHVSRRLLLDLSGDHDFPSTQTAALRCQMGQAVACGTRHGVPVSALRLCVSARLIVEATTVPDGAQAVIARAIRALDKAALLAQRV